MSKIKCIECGDERLQKYGKTKAGRQKYRCLNPECRHQFVGESIHRINPEKKRMAVSLLTDNVSPAAISRATGISIRWLNELRGKINT